MGEQKRSLKYKLTIRPHRTRYPRKKELSVKRQCELLDVNRTSSYRIKGVNLEANHGESIENVNFMRIIYELHQVFPSWGYRKTTSEQSVKYGVFYTINRKF